MTEKEYADRCRDFADRMARLLSDIVDCEDERDLRVMMREAEQIGREWHRFATVAYKQMRVSE